MLRLLTIARALCRGDTAASVIEYGLLALLIATVVGIAGLTLRNAISTESANTDPCGARGGVVTNAGASCRPVTRTATGTTDEPVAYRGVRWVRRLVPVSFGVGGTDRGVPAVVYALLLVLAVAVGSIVGRNRGRRVAPEAGAVEPGLVPPGIGTDDRS
jgi:Flp pilus assembly pilin Flp